MAHLSLEAGVRKSDGKGAVNRLRREGYIPAVLYGVSNKNIPIMVKEKDFHDIKHSGGEHGVIDLSVEGDVSPTVIKEQQFDPVWGRLLHIDFCRVKLTEKMTVEVGIETVGESAGEKVGGIVDHVMREIEVECLPDRIPESIEVDISDLEIGDLMHVRDLKMPEGVEVVGETDRVVLYVLAPKEEEEIEAEEAVEPELVGAEEGAEEGEEAPEEGAGKEGREKEKEKAEGEKEQQEEKKGKKE